MNSRELYEAQTTLMPKVGDKCTMHLWSDSHACQVSKVSASGKTIWIKRNAVVADPSKENGMGHQNWIIRENKFESDDEMKCTRRKDGRFRESGSNNLITIGLWHEHYDWEF